jgi:hypothetical protein
VRTYCIRPTFEVYDGILEAKDARVRACLGLVTDIVFDCLRWTGDHFHFAVDWRDPASAPWQGGCDEATSPHIVDLRDPIELKSTIYRSVDPYCQGQVPIIRSVQTCRMATFGRDGQAMLCLRHEDPIPRSPDLSLVSIEIRPDMLVECDYFDGWLPDER